MLFGLRIIGVPSRPLVPDSAQVPLRLLYGVEFCKMCKSHTSVEYVFSVRLVSH